ncbi:MAG: sigma 54-interacting transcriptional regulator [Planctomycetes bacterium]|nr:sigma 54-interacting transcriptional regulator [Planctomycetota bacterium]
MYAYLTILTGNRIGTNFPLDPSRDTLLGRGSDCHISVPDPMCSRVHAIVRYEDESWVIRDQKSRNGTLVNSQKVGEATLDDGHVVRIGSSEFELHLSDEPPTADTDDGASLSQTIVQDMPIAVQQSNQEVLAALPTPEQVQELLLLYQLSIHLLGCENPEIVIRVALGLLKARTKAAVVGFLWADEEAQLRPKLVIPQEAVDHVKLSKSLTELVLSQGHAVWVANQTEGAKPTDSVTFADAVCAPLVRKGPDGERRTLGAIHVYLEDGRFRQSDFDFIIAVANLAVIALVRARSAVSLRSHFERLVQASPGYDEQIGDSKVMRELKNKIARVSTAPGCVLVQGESGTGKELVARAIHRGSPRADSPMISVNCASIPEDLMESQLFGHKAGSFTGADRDHSGFFQQADLGILFLDEIGELTLEGQAKLLRVLEGHPFLPIGATEEIQVDVRVIAATNQDLQTYVQKKKFREDLYYRLNVIAIDLPPLRDRKEDIPLLVRHFFTKYGEENQKSGLAFSPEVMKLLMNYGWPGNIRELENLVERSVVLASGSTIGLDLLPDSLRQGNGLSAASRNQFSVQLNGDSLSEMLQDYERRIIVKTLERAGGRQTEAAEQLKVPLSTLNQKIKRLHIPLHRRGES